MKSERLRHCGLGMRCGCEAAGKYQKASQKQAADSPKSDCLAERRLPMDGARSPPPKKNWLCRWLARASVCALQRLRERGRKNDPACLPNKKSDFRTIKRKKFIELFRPTDPMETLGEGLHQWTRFQGRDFLFAPPYSPRGRRDCAARGYPLK